MRPQKHKNRGNQRPSASYARQPHHERYSFRPANPYQWISYSSQNDELHPRNKYADFSPTANDQGYSRINKPHNFPPPQQFNGFVHHNYEQNTSEFARFKSAFCNREEFIDHPKLDKTISKPNKPTLKPDKPHLKQIDEALNETIDTVKRKLQERRLSNGHRDSDHKISSDSLDCGPSTSKILEKKRIEHSKMLPKTCLEKKYSKKDDHSVKSKNTFSSEVPKLNYINRSERIRKKILQQLFKLDNHNLRQILSQPESSAKYNFALTSLLKDTRKMLSKQLRTVAEKSLKYHNVSANTVQGEKIVRDAFLGHLETMLDPNASIELFSMEPQIINELSKVLQEDLMNSGNEDLSIQNLAETIQKNFLCDMEEENINNGNNDFFLPLMNVKLKEEKSLTMENSYLQEVELPHPYEEQVPSPHENLIETKSDFSSTPREMQKFNISVVKLSSLMEDNDNNTYGAPMSIQNLSQNSENFNELPDILPANDSKISKTAEIYCQSPKVELSKEVDEPFCNKNTNNDVPEILQNMNNENTSNSNLLKHLESNRHENPNCSDMNRPFVQNNCTVLPSTESRHTQYDICDKSDTHTQVYVSYESAETQYENLEVPVGGKCNVVLTDSYCQTDKMFKLGDYVSPKSIPPKNCGEFTLAEILKRMKKIDENIKNLTQEKMKLYDFIKIPQSAGSNSFFLPDSNTLIETRNLRRKIKLRKRLRMKRKRIEHSDEPQAKETNLTKPDEKITINKFYSLGTNGKLTVHQNMQNIELPSVDSLQTNDNSFIERCDLIDGQYKIVAENRCQNNMFSKIHKKSNHQKVDSFKFENKAEGLIKNNLNPIVILHDCHSVSKKISSPMSNNSNESMCRVSVTIDSISLSPTALLDQKESILAIKNVGSNILAGSEDGNLYNFCIKNRKLKKTIKCSNEAITSLFIKRNTNIVYIGSLDSHLYCFDFEKGTSLFSPINVNGPIQSMCHAWNTLFIGTRIGVVVQFNTNVNKLGSSISFLNQSILDLKATKEGPRKVLVIASRSQNVVVKDANSGLLLRTLDGSSKTVYSILFHAGQVFCGTSDCDIQVFDFVTGELVSLHTGGKGTVCLQIYNGFLFAGCYDGIIYIFKLGAQNPISCIHGPGKMLLSMTIDKEMITGAYKDRSLYIWSIPKDVMERMELEIDLDP